MIYTTLLVRKLSFLLQPHFFLFCPFLTGAFFAFLKGIKVLPPQGQSTPPVLFLVTRIYFP
jgi:hypothetical protein